MRLLGCDAETHMSTREKPLHLSLFPCAMGGPLFRVASQTFTCLGEDFTCLFAWEAVCSQERPFSKVMFPQGCHCLRGTEFFSLVLQNSPKLGTAAFIQLAYPKGVHEVKGFWLSFRYYSICTANGVSRSVLWDATTRVHNPGNLDRETWFSGLPMRVTLAFRINHWLE